MSCCENMHLRGIMVQRGMASGFQRLGGSHFVLETQGATPRTGAHEYPWL